MRVRWSARADRNVVAIAVYIAEDGPAAATAMVQRLRSRAAELANFPEQGRRGRVNGTRELPVAGTPYLIVYRVSSEEVTILRILHGAQLWPPRQP